MKISCPQLGHAGRLGNQLFQIAATLGLAETYGATIQFPPWDYEPFFSVPKRLFGDIDADAVDMRTLLPHIDERARDYAQDYNLFSDVEEQIRRWFDPSDYAREVLSDERFNWVDDLPKPVLAIHVRRGDLVAELPGIAAYHPLRPMSYYDEALKIHQAYPNPHRSILIFSDDIPWCREAFAKYKDEEIHFFEGGESRFREFEPEHATQPITDWIDFQVMAKCYRFIIGNSTFAWWAAFNSYSDCVIYGTPWFGPALDYIDASLMFPPLWIELNYAT